MTKALPGGNPDCLAGPIVVGYLPYNPAKPVPGGPAMPLGQRTPCARTVALSPAASLPALWWCRCFLCACESGVPVPLPADQTTWVECEGCGLDNEIPKGTPA